MVTDIREFEAMREKLSIIEDIEVSRAQIAAGQGIPHDEAKTRVLRSLGSASREPAHRRE